MSVSVKKFVGEFPDESLDFIGRFLKSMEGADDQEFVEMIKSAQRKMSLFSHPARIEFNQIERTEFGLPSTCINHDHFYSESKFNSERIVIWGKKEYVLSCCFALNIEFDRLEKAEFDYTNRINFMKSSNCRFHSSIDAKSLFYHIREHGVESLIETILAEVV